LINDPFKEALNPDEQLESVIQTITLHARSGSTGDHGDGIIFVSTIEHAINIVHTDIGNKTNKFLHDWKWLIMNLPLTILCVTQQN
jgi:hypothetical protein